MGQQAERATVWAAQGTEVALIDRQNVVALLPLSQHHDGSISQAKLQIGIALDNCAYCQDICITELLNDLSGYAPRATSSSTINSAACPASFVIK